VHYRIETLRGGTNRNPWPSKAKDTSRVAR
jgi:hypothetical protein